MLLSETNHRILHLNVSPRYSFQVALWQDCISEPKHPIFGLVAIELIISLFAFFFFYALNAEQDNGHSCLNLIHNRNSNHHIAWAPYGGQSIRDTEIGINGLVAQEIGNEAKNKQLTRHNNI